MADTGDSKPSIPFAGLAGVVLAAVAVLVSHDAAFLDTRPAERERPEDDSIAAQRVDARLWQDPFSAVEDFERREAARLNFDAEASRLSPGSASAKGPPATTAGFAVRRFGVALQDFRKLVAPTASGPRQLLVLPVLVDGSHFVGAEEARRRTRYATVSALDELGYAPLSPDHIGYVVVPGEASADAPPVRVPFEFFSTAAHTARASVPSGGTGWLPAEVLLLWVDDSALAAPRTGGSWLDALGDVLVALGICQAGAAPCPVPIVGPTSSDRFQMLAATLPSGARAVSFPWLVSPFVTSEVIADVRITDVLDKRGIRVLRTIASDRKVFHALATELAVRAVPLCDKDKVILMLGEWDTEYGRRAPGTLTRVLSERGCETPTPIVSYSFARGLDGVAVGAPSTAPSAAQATPTSAGAPPTTPIEWPESADQRDYLRRIGQQLTSINIASRVVAVGVMASDAHDKLLLLQELRDLFPRAPFFTTDIDARFSHPLVQAWTHKLIVGGGYGLVVGSDVQQRTAAFRDGYQSATFLAVTAAVQLPGCADGCTGLDMLARQQPQLFEVGHSRLVPLLPDTGESSQRTLCNPRKLDECPRLQPIYQTSRRSIRTFIAFGVGFTLLAVTMVGWAWRRPLAAAEPAPVTAQPTTPARRQVPAPGPVMAIVFQSGLVLSLAVGAVLGVQVLAPTLRSYPPEPLLFNEGVSSWPVACCWALALCLTFMFLLRLTLTMQARFEATAAQYLGCATQPGATGAAAPMSYWRWLWESMFSARAPAALGSAERAQFADIWARYRANASGWRRVRRVAVIWVVLFAVPFVAVNGWALTPPTVIRGGFRAVIVALDYAHSAALTILMAAVADAALLCTLFVLDVGRQRNSYPDEVLDRTCERLGLSARLRPFVDEYIDTEVVGHRTAAIAAYLYYPFIVLAVLALAMTRIFDDWVFVPARVGLYAFYVVILLLLWLGLHGSATRARTTALAEMDLIWLRLQRDTGDSDELARKQFPLLVERVRANMTGAYGPLLAQPIFRALLWPLGGISGAQLIQYFALR